MAHLVEVEDPTDERLADYVRLRDVSLRRRLETERGLFIAEGALVVRRALTAGCAPRSFLLSPRWLEPLRDVLDHAGPDVPAYVLDDAHVQHLTGFHVHRGALAALHRPAELSVDRALDGARRVVVLEDLVDHTNVGAVLRSAAALGVDAVLLTPRCADPLYRRSVKVAMGAVFRLPWARLPSWRDAPELLARAGLLRVALDPAPDALDLDVVAREHRDRRLALLLGAEGPGLSDAWRRAADVRARIPMARDVDSLNVAAAAAVACYALRA